VLNGLSRLAIDAVRNLFNRSPIAGDSLSDNVLSNLRQCHSALMLLKRPAKSVLPILRFAGVLIALGSGHETWLSICLRIESTQVLDQVSDLFCVLSVGVVVGLNDEHAFFEPLEGS
jgi:hypothetical protein